MSDTTPGRFDENGRHIVNSLLDRRLTVSRAILILGLGFGALVLYALYDSRTQWAPFLWQSPALLVGLLVGLVLIAGGAAVQNLQRQHQAANQSLLGLMQEQAKELRQELAQMRRDTLTERLAHSAEMDRLRAELSDVKVKEAACQERVEALRQAVAGVKAQAAGGQA